MKILIISPTHKGIGGIAQHVNGLIEYLKSINHEVEIISSENTFTIPIKGLKNPSFMFSAFLKTKFKKHVDIVHAHNIPTFLAMKNTSGKKILTLHGIYSQQIGKLHSKASTKIATKYEKEALDSADAITVVTKETHEHYAKLGYETYYVPNAINIKSLPLEEDRRFQKQIIFAGRLSNEKGISTLVTLAKNLPLDVHLLILGSGPEENKIKNLQKENIHFLGYQPKEKTIRLIRGSDILIQPSEIEGLSSTVLEAMACETPVICTNVGGNKEILEDNKTGILVDLNSIENFSDSILNLLSNETKAKDIAKNAFDEVQKYDWSKIGPQYLMIYEKLLK